MTLKEYRAEDEWRAGQISDEWRYTGREVEAVIGYVLHAIPHPFRGAFQQQGHNLEGYIVFSLLESRRTSSPTTSETP